MIDLKDAAHAMYNRKRRPRTCNHCPITCYRCNKTIINGKILEYNGKILEYNRILKGISGGLRCNDCRKSVAEFDNKVVYCRVLEKEVKYTDKPICTKDDIFKFLIEII